MTRTHDEMFQLGGGHEFADQVCDGVEARCLENMNASGHASVGVMFNTIEIMWLVEAYRRLRAESEEVTDGA